ncbi:dTDP-4-dehydrorhamnose 3,5-epimerase [Herbaspirillum rhizosphaerae]|uniref:dTDP-4-dehydrorhamnose 3,5-epimerase n=1 Tax=Herbaspirillum rhizosphaerae TaxID=346179 RepID=UPI00067AF885|nr:dTDP-4-dehydrorhamnose 3,5-epimerase [Herbaspirillum rhizosphaerae]
MKIIPTEIPDVMVVEPTVFGDARGFFFESFNTRRFAELTGITANFVQDNHSRSARNVLRGLHYQIQHPQGKLVRVTVGEVLDIAVDIRKNSPTFGKWTGTILSAENKLQMWIPPGFAHGFLVRSEYAEFLYKTTDYWMAEHERCILWNDPAIDIDWRAEAAPLLSAKDVNGKLLADAEVFA